MINIDIRLENPFKHRWNPIKAWFGKIAQHVAYELNMFKSNTIINVYVRTQVRGDHKGIYIILGLLGYDIEFNIYDTRHEN